MPCKPAVWSLEQEQRLEEAILVGSYSFSIRSAWSLLALWKEDVVTGQGPSNTDALYWWCSSVTDLCHNQVTAVFSVPVRSFALTHEDIQVCNGPEKKCKKYASWYQEDVKSFFFLWRFLIELNMHQLSFVFRVMDILVLKVLFLSLTSETSSLHRSLVLYSYFSTLISHHTWTPPLQKVSS